MWLSADLVFQPSLTPVLSWGALIRVLLLSSSLRNTNSSVFSLQSAEDKQSYLPLNSPFFFFTSLAGRNSFIFGRHRREKSPGNHQSGPLLAPPAEPTLAGLFTTNFNQK